ncbi:MAG: biotin--[acetyl-CoA-carboxylase] ligase [Muribaculaceae bacterium]|nr:biotin--[acetyl-CoA-carboxylase] ligase [Muribaculaceae bacterium]
MNLQIIEECVSTNAAIPREAPHGFALMALKQNAGRGQRGNSWESESGKNITLSLMLRPEGMEAARQFEISEAVALGVLDLLRSLGIEDVAVKWPNDVYVGDRKVCGILIENALAGPYVSRSIAGIGLNVNQRKFLSDAPNPVSLRQLTGREYPLAELAEEMVGNILRRLESGKNHVDFLANLYRRSGSHPWALPDGTRFLASIINVSPTGFLTLSEYPDRPFAFKEVSYLISN